MKLVVISVCAPGDVYVIQRIRATRQIDWVIRPAAALDSTTRSFWARLKRVSAAKVMHRVRGRFYRWQARGMNHRMSQLLFAGPPPGIECSTMAMDRVNTPEVVARLRSLAPDLLIVSGGPVLGPEMFTIPRLGTVNLHWGIAPEYRGSDTLFWPLYLRDQDRIGVTLHYVDAGIDTGRVLGRGYPALEPDDDEAAIWAKCARTAAEMIVRFLAALDQGHRPAGEPQGAPGRWCRSRDRRVWRTLLHAARRAMLKERLAARVERIVMSF